jgi:hypothetical protein
MKQTQILLVTLAIALVFTLTACPPGPGPDPDPGEKLSTLSGNVTISPNGTVTANTELTATYSGTETVTYQWYKDNTAISGATSARYTPTAAGSYTVTVNASGYTSKTSAAVTVTEPDPAHVHTWGAWTETTAPTCTTAGEETRTCTLDATHTETRAGAAALGHDWGNWVVTTPATATVEGTETRTCKRDATHTETQTIAKLTAQCPCPPNTVHPFGTTCPAGCVGVGKNGCGCTIGAAPALVTKTYPITFKDGALKFTVQYRALQSAPAPAYLTYLQTRLALIVNGTSESATEATEFLMSKGNSFTINVEYTGNTPGISWDAATQSFKVYNDWISTATGGALTAPMIIDAFESVQ